MEIYALSGPSGTGKSTIALEFAHEKKIPAIIDDGLLIVNGNKVAGFSAKFEKNSYTAVKRATFFDLKHRNEVKESIRNCFIGKILIIGTSEKMVRLIAKNLKLGEISKIYHVQEIRSSSEIQIAQFIRRTEGKHVIPIPFRQVEQNFFKKLIRRGFAILSHKNELIAEVTIVQPDFQKGIIKIGKNVYRDIILHICNQYGDIKYCKSLRINLEGLPIIHLTLILKSPISYSIKELMDNIQKDIKSYFEQIFSIELHAINLRIQRAEK